MPLVAATLASALESEMDIVDNEPNAIANFCAAFESYIYDASVMGIPATAGSLAGALSTMQGAMTGMSTAGSAAIQAGITAFWGVVATSAASIWATTPPAIAATPPPNLGTISATLDGVFAANTAGSLEKAAAMSAIANALHPLMLGGICTLPAPPTGPGPQPIL